MIYISSHGPCGVDYSECLGEEPPSIGDGGKGNDKTIKSKIAKKILNSIDIIKPLINDYYREPAININ